MNAGNEALTINPYARIAKAVIQRVERPEWVVVDSPDQLSETERGTDGYGSTGKQ
jgi:dUTPase